MSHSASQDHQLKIFNQLLSVHTVCSYPFQIFNELFSCSWPCIHNFSHQFGIQFLPFQIGCSPVPYLFDTHAFCPFKGTCLLMFSCERSYFARVLNRTLHRHCCAILCCYIEVHGRSLLLIKALLQLWH